MPSLDAHLVVISVWKLATLVAATEAAEEDKNFQTTSIDSNAGQWHLVC